MHSPWSGGLPHSAEVDLERVHHLIARHREFCPRCKLNTVSLNSPSPRRVLRSEAVFIHRARWLMRPPPMPRKHQTKWQQVTTWNGSQSWLSLFSQLHWFALARLRPVRQLTRIRAVRRSRKSRLRSLKLNRANRLSNPRLGRRRLLHRTPLMPWPLGRGAQRPPRKPYRLNKLNNARHYQLFSS